MFVARVHTRSITFSSIRPLYLSMVLLTRKGIDASSMIEDILYLRNSIDPPTGVLSVILVLLVTSRNLCSTAAEEYDAQYILFMQTDLIDFND